MIDTKTKTNHFETHINQDNPQSHSNNKQSHKQINFNSYANYNRNAASPSPKMNQQPLSVINQLRIKQQKQRQNISNLKNQNLFILDRQYLSKQESPKEAIQKITIKRKQQFQNFVTTNKKIDDVCKRNLSKDNNKDRKKENIFSQLKRIKSTLKLSQCCQMAVTIAGTQQKSFTKTYTSTNYDQNSTSAFFQGDALRGDDDYRMNLAESLKHILNQSFSCTRLLFRYDSLNTTNIHCYIDNHPHIVLIARLDNGSHVAAYSQYGFNPRMVKKGNGMLFSLTNRRSYPVKPGKCSIVYDDNYLIFGNTELRISSHDNKFYSNFGVNSGYYEANGDNIQNFIGTSQRQITFQHLEIFQILFD